MIFPVLFLDPNEVYFTVIVRFLDYDRPTNVFPLQFPILFETDPCQIIRCIFYHLKPINVRIIYKYRNDP